MIAQRVYFLIAAVIFLLEVAIATGFLGGATIRGSVGDILAVVLVYFLLRPVLTSAPVFSAIIAVLTGFVVEFFQYIHILERLGVARGNPLYVIFGNTFSGSDLVMYTLGGVIAFGTDRYLLIPWLHNRLLKFAQTSAKEG